MKILLPILKIFGVLKLKAFAFALLHYIPFESNIELVSRFPFYTVAKVNF